MILKSINFKLNKINFDLLNIKKNHKPKLVVFLFSRVNKFLSKLSHALSPLFRLGRWRF